ncbi:PREDICTED: LOW QUALITY PROTEIN: inactive caspase-12-like [Rhinopithecus bieti]|uniref:LOW QUALITY PROTEIN: inactive caspase-12-like n=1 Tax=Rhinopithecus bieti TaxID=61621 RepID=UPI00083C6766|nr:PREDICTED: LOW QUALITY PROTEIN: inactive caspase-12-like [Rhinopithecus bieti]
MADEKPSKGVRVHMVKSLVITVLVGIFDDLVENNVLNTEELHTLGKCVKIIVHNAENLVEDITETAQTAGKMCRDHLCNPEKQLSLDISSDGERGPNTPGLIICNKEFHYLHNRNGSELDLLEMQDLLENLGYSVVIEENLTARGTAPESRTSCFFLLLFILHFFNLLDRFQPLNWQLQEQDEMATALRQFAARPEHQSSDSTFLVLMSHGILNGICGTKHWDQEPDVLHDDTIFEIFNNRNCWSLRDKPKVIITQACRGNGAGIVWFTTDSGKASADTHGQLLQSNICNDAVTKAHVEKDFIAFKSSTPHNVSWRHEISGSVFISQIIYYFKEYSWSHHLEEIFRKVQRSFETPNVVTQLPTIERLSMTRYFYLFPGN